MTTNEYNMFQKFIPKILNPNKNVYMYIEKWLGIVISLVVTKFLFGYNTRLISKNSTLHPSNSIMKETVMNIDILSPVISSKQQLYCYHCYKTETN